MFKVSGIKTINLFYGEPDPDRWLKFDRFPRRIIRRIIRGRPPVGGVGTIAVNLMKGLDKIGQPYRFNDYKYIKQHPDEVACIIGKPHLLYDKRWENPVILGAGIFSHPIDNPKIFGLYPHLKKILVPGPWIWDMFVPYYGDSVASWAIGIDTEKWSPLLKAKPETDFLIYDKVRWDHDTFEKDLISPLCDILKKKRLSYEFIRYGSYKHTELIEKLKRAQNVIFLCEHETQGLAYQQILATGTPVLAWDRAGYWEDPFYFPDKVQYQPVSSVPYWDERCGLKFKNIDEFEPQLNNFLKMNASFNPRDYIMENLTLEKSALAYVNILEAVESKLLSQERF